jgi:hypothetical protein
VIERHVLLKNDHEVLDGTWTLVLIRFGRALSEARQRHQGDQTQTGGADHHGTFHANEEFHSMHLRFLGKRCPLIAARVLPTPAPRCGLLLTFTPTQGSVTDRLRRDELFAKVPYRPTIT